MTEMENNRAPEPDSEDVPSDQRTTAPLSLEAVEKRQKSVGDQITRPKDMTGLEAKVDVWEQQYVAFLIGRDLRSMDRSIFDKFVRTPLYLAAIGRALSRLSPGEKLTKVAAKERILELTGPDLFDQNWFDDSFESIGKIANAGS